MKNKCRFGLGPPFPPGSADRALLPPAFCAGPPPVKELASNLGLQPQTIYNQVSAGSFPIMPKRLGRLLKWDRKDVDRFLDKLPATN